MKTKRALLYTLGAALTLTAMTTMRTTDAPMLVRSADIAPQLNDAPYRDGLFQGKLAAARGGANRPNISRWSNDEDRSHFALGYEWAYLYAGPRSP